MTAMEMYRMDSMFEKTSEGSMDASASHTHCACARASFSTIISILDAMILASIFVVISLVVLRGLSNSLVLAVLVQLAVLLGFRRMTPKR